MWSPTYVLTPPISSSVKATRLPSGAQSTLVNSPQKTGFGQCQTTRRRPPGRISKTFEIPFPGLEATVSDPGFG